MEQKQAYIEYKNTVLMSLVNRSDQMDNEVGSESVSDSPSE